jgi:transposase
LTTKIHVLADEQGLPVDFVVTAGQANDCTQAIPLLGERTTGHVLADKGYDSDAIVEHVAAMGAVVVTRPNATGRCSANTTKTFTNREIASNAAVAGVFAIG